MSERHRLCHTEEVMGTVFSFDIRDAATPAIESALGDAVRWLHRVDAIFSTYRPGSQISRLARGELTVAECDAEVAEVLRLCRGAGHRSGGAFTASPGGRLDPSGMVKGWATERASRILYAAGSRHHLVNGGGDIQARGGSAPGRPWRCGIADPWRGGEVAAVVPGRDLAVATSGTAERGHHILDPATGEPPTALVSITLVGRHLTEVDALATAAFVKGERAHDWVASLPGVEAFALTADGHAWWTPGFAALGGTVNDRAGAAR
ncbi:FAD:protein FMN transferase [Streptomyces cucumeris]|uniref:FAD:protein FMN transferase n=1 Tax=Streptomyces cucumeris TaxID=2962890 RepID=UPI003D74DA82